MNDFGLIPDPVKVCSKPGHFSLSSTTCIVHDDENHEVAVLLQETLLDAIGIRVPVFRDWTKMDNVILLSSWQDDDHLGAEAYVLEVRPDLIQIRASDRRGSFYGVQTLLQLMPPDVFHTDGLTLPLEIRCVKIEDYPRFSWRGMMLDVSRHFFPIEFLYKFVDLLALHKMNIFHLHLTDDQGWRVEIEQYPRLTSIGAWRNETLIGHLRDESHAFDDLRHGGYYTQSQLEAFVKYAQIRNVTIVPEIDMPGHTQAIIAAYPELGITDEHVEVWNRWGVSRHLLNMEEDTFVFAQNVIDEVLALFPGPTIHLGGDEVDSELWASSSETESRMKHLELKSVRDIQPYFLAKMTEHIERKGRRVIGWDEIIAGGVSDDTIVMSWRGVDGGVMAAGAGNDVIMAPRLWTYFDSYQSEDTDEEPLAIGGTITLEKAYEFEPIPSGMSDEIVEHFLGAQGQLWTEYMPNTEHVEYMAFPRTTALSEVLWSPLANRNFVGFTHRLVTHLRRLDHFGVSYRVP